ncbi:Integrase core domain [Popillia japonica]|uniref:Integrase core domain n=1 Tax=Popillia japonica TaxID=7064 RepID=A0AAW1LB23_POPJA
MTLPRDRIRLRSVLKALEVDVVLEKVPDERKDEAWHKKNNKATMVIIQSIADSHLEYIKDIGGAYEMLEKLEATFAKRGTCSKFYLLEELTQLKYNCNTSIQDHFTKCDKIFRELKDLGSSFDESDMACFLLLSMPTEFENVVTAIRTLSDKELKMDFVKKRLLEFDISKGSTKQAKGIPSSFAARNSIKCFKCGKMGHPSSFAARNSIKCFKCGKMGHTKQFCGIKCYICHKFGHKAAQCHQNKDKSKTNFVKKEDKQTSYVQEEEVVSFCCIEASNVTSEMEWYADSGATHHYINNDEAFINKRVFADPKVIQLAEKGKSMAAVCEGDVEIVSTVGGKPIKINLTNVLCVPELRVNLLSISRIEKNGFKIVYVDGVIQLAEKGKSMAAVCEGDVEILVEGLDFVSSAENKICDVCVRSKQKCLPYFSKRLRSNRVLELVHTDVCGPINPVSHTGNMYFVTFVDDYSRFVMVYVIEHKDEVLKCFKDYEAKVSALFSNKKIAKLKCDNGREYCSNSFLKFCEEKGIEISYTPPYTPQMNGVAERMNQTISYTPPYTPQMNGVAERMNQTLMDKASCSYCCVFNQQNAIIFAYARVPDSLRTKLDDKGIKCKFVGYTENGYRLWNERENKKLINQYIVIFDELNFIPETNKPVHHLNESTDSDEREEVEQVFEENRNNDGEGEEDRHPTCRPKRNRKRPTKLDDYEIVDDYEIDVSCLALLSNFLEVPVSYGMDQISAIKNLKFNVENSKDFKTPMEKDLNLERNTEEETKTKLPYKELLGSLMYIMMGSRPDICFSCSAILH